MVPDDAVTPFYAPTRIRRIFGRFEERELKWWLAVVAAAIILSVVALAVVR